MSRERPSRDAADRPCPECKRSGHGHGRIGNRRSKCRTCNAFARRLERAVARALFEADPERAARVREDCEARLYAELTERTS